MYKMVLADDEYLVCEYISHIVKKYQLPIQICGTADNGKDAIRLVDEHKPDFVILDINMPGVDGLEAAKKIRQKNSSVIIYILTAYRHFDYVRDAMHSAVLDYLVKPIKPDELVAVLQDGILKASKQRLSALQKEQVNKKIELQEHQEKQQVLYELLEMNGSDEKVLSAIHNLSNQTMIKPVAIMCLSYWRSENPNKRVDKDIILKYSKKFSSIALVISSTTDVAIFLDSWNEEIRKKVYNLIDTCEKINGYSFCVRVSMIYNRSISSAYKECRKACKIGRFWCQAGKESIFKYGEKKLQYTETVDLKKVQEELEAHVLAHEEQQCQELIEHIFSFMKQHEYSTDLTNTNITKIGCKIIGKSSGVILSNEEADILERDFLQCLSTAKFAFSMKNTLHCVLSHLMRKIPLNKNNAEKIAEWAVQYIEKNYADEITLESIADELFVSTSYLCRVFKKHVGKGYVSYLNDVRMKKAKSLLCSNKFTVSEVAKSVGFRDASYFSSVFKRYYHCPPSSFVNDK